MDINEFRNRKLKLGFVGLGLIGASLAKAFRENMPNVYIVAYNRSEYPRKMAYEDGTADVVTESIDDNFKELDYIFLCTPVEYNELYLEQLKDVITPGCIITDVGSTKTNIHKAVERFDMEECFIGGHPMAGSEKTGYDNSVSTLFENAVYGIVPTNKTNNNTIEEMELLAQVVGARPVILKDYEEHDYIVAGISHLPHIISVELVNLVQDRDSDNGLMKIMAAGGFRDTTRIAASSPEMWEQICMTNKEHIVTLLDDYIDNLIKTRDKIKEGDGQYIFDMFTKSRGYRNQFGKKTNI